VPVVRGQWPANPHCSEPQATDYGSLAIEIMRHFDHFTVDKPPTDEGCNSWNLDRVGSDSKVIYVAICWRRLFKNPAGGHIRRDACKGRTEEVEQWRLKSSKNKFGAGVTRRANAVFSWPLLFVGRASAAKQPVPLESKGGSCKLPCMP